MRKGMVSAAIAFLLAAGTALFVAGFGGFGQDDLIHWHDFLQDHDSLPHCADFIFAVVLAAVAYWRGMADA